MAMHERGEKPHDMVTVMPASGISQICGEEQVTVLQIRAAT